MISENISIGFSLTALFPKALEGFYAMNKKIISESKPSICLAHENIISRLMT